VRYACILFTLVVASFTFGCAPMVIEGRKIDSMKVKQLVAGVTNLGKVQEFFGKPDQIDKLPTGEENYIYKYRRQNPHWWTLDKIDAQKLEVLIKDGIVQTYKFREEGKEVVLRDK